MLLDCDRDDHSRFSITIAEAVVPETHPPRPAIEASQRQMPIQVEPLPQ